MSDSTQQQLGNTLWAIADKLRGAMNADDFRDYMLAFLFLRYLSDNYEIAARKELGSDYPELKADSYLVPLSIWGCPGSMDRSLSRYNWLVSASIGCNTQEASQSVRNDFTRRSSRCFSPVTNRLRSETII
jgi:hypothetical protein